jgi:KaiC/GvpD/RAD55 family RecA-like ATPase
MSHAEDVLFTLLSDTDSLDELVRDGMSLACVPTEAARPIVQWCIDYFHESDLTRAPTVEMIREMWGEQVEDLEIDLGDGTETDTMESVIGALKKTYVEWKSQEFVKSLGTRMAKADPTEKVATLTEGAEELWNLASTFVRSDTKAPSSTAATASLLRYEKRLEEGPQVKGIRWGIDQIDNHYYGIHPGELGLLAAGPKVGKSWWAALAALANWSLGAVVVLVTMENSKDMTWDRLMCLAAGIDYSKFQTGQMDISEELRLRSWEKTFTTTSNQLHVVSPEDGKRTARAIVETARLMQADALIIDQLTFMEHPHPGRLARHEVIRDIMHDLKNSINGRTEIPCLLNHQINREGVKAAQKTGYLEMYHMAEGAEVERTADAVFGLYQSLVERRMGTAKFQGLATRRVESKSWEIAWAPWSGAKPVALSTWEPPVPTTDDDKKAA